MKHLLLGIFIAGLAISSQGQVLKRIDPTKQAAINGKTVGTNTLGFSTLPKGIFPTSTAPINTSEIKQTTLKHDRLKYSTVDLPQHATALLPKSNFTAKRAIVRGAVATEVKVSDQKAPILDREIRANTPKALKNSVNSSSAATDS